MYQPTTSFLRNLIIVMLISITPLLAQDYPIRPVEFTQVRFQSAFWSPRLETNRQVTIPFAFQKCEETGRIDNFAIAGGLKKGKFRGISYDDSDVFKVIEGAAYSLATHPDPELEKYLDDLIMKIAAAQEDDGYLFTIRTIYGDTIQDKRAGPVRWSNLQDSHELYNVGHLYEAAVAHYLATQKKNLLDVATKNADLLVKTFGEGKRYEVPGHEETELGLVKLYRVTGNKNYLELARFFIGQRGRHEHRKPYIADWANPVDSTYYQDHIPVIEQTEPTGHVVRAGYLYSGMADVAALTGESSYANTISKLWDYTINKKLYVTGGLGAAAGVEGFGPAYDLPNLTAYNETCAAIASMLWNYRLFLLTGEGKYIDILERTLYNGFLSGVSLEGNLFFYPNPLASDGKRKFNHGHATRSPWFNTSCCPTNVARFLPSLPGYQYAVRGDQVFLNLFIAGKGSVKTQSQAIQLTQETHFPWEGKVKLTVEPEKPAAFALHVRIPGWANNKPTPGDLYRYIDQANSIVSVKVNGNTTDYQTQNGYAVLNQTWKKGDVVEIDMPMPVRQVMTNENVSENRNKVAIERGPLVYCVEGVDNGGKLSGITIHKNTRFTTQSKPDLLNGIIIIQGKNAKTSNSAPIFTAIPYYAWSHRGAGEMAVWLPRDK